MKRYSNMTYRLTQSVSLHGCSCKLPKKELSELLQKANIEETTDERVLAGIWDDAGIVKASEDMVVVQHLDFFTPIIDDPYVQGQIAACNSVSDVFAKGATNILGVLIIMANPTDMPDKVLTQLIQGFHDLCQTIKAPIVGGHTIQCPWPLMGGSVTALEKASDVIYNSTAQDGDILFLTKPLGTQPVMAILRVPSQEQESLTRKIPENTISMAIDKAIKTMTTPNKDAAEAMVEAEVNSATDVTGFGILGQAKTMAKRGNVNIELHTLPVIEGSIELSREFGYGLEEGVSAETSGGLLISAPGNRADFLVSLLEKREIPAWEVGTVKMGEGNANLSKRIKFVNI